MTLIRGDPQGYIPENKSPAPDEKKRERKRKSDNLFLQANHLCPTLMSI